MVSKSIVCPTSIDQRGQIIGPMLQNRFKCLDRKLWLLRLHQGESSQVQLNNQIRSCVRKRGAPLRTTGNQSYNGQTSQNEQTHNLVNMSVLRTGTGPRFELRSDAFVRSTERLRQVQLLKDRAEHYIMRQGQKLTYLPRTRLLSPLRFNFFDDFLTEAVCFLKR